MKNLLTILFIITSIIVAQSGSVNYDELIRQYPQLKVNNSNRSNSNIQGLSEPVQFDFTDYTETELLLLDSLGVLSTLIDTIEIEEPAYFGYKFFNTPDKFAVFDNIPIPGNYHLGPGDQLIISIWGATQSRSRHLINRDGDIFIDGVGQINLAGLDINAVENILEERFSEVYSTLKGNNPSTFLSISLGQLKSINISFVGEVSSPGIHAVHPFSDITTALLQVGGVDTIGSLRNIQVIRDGDDFINFDFYEYLVSGKTKLNTRLLSGDIIFVPVRQSTVSIEGEINRPGIYESKSGESIAELIHFAGDLTQKAQPKLEIYRLLPINERISEDYAYKVFYSNIEQLTNEPAKDIERIRVLSVPDVTREVSIFGQVKTSGTYAYEDSMTILDLLKIAGGLNDKTYLESIFTKEAEVIRHETNSIYPKRISINLQQLLDNQNDQNIKLQNRDIVLVRENINYTEPEYVTLSGKINIPGKYTIQQKEETLSDILLRAGGFSSNAFVNGLQMYRDSMQVVLHGYDVFVAGGDSVHVPEPPGVIKIEGEVNREGLVQFVKGKSISYYIERAGGFSYNADKRNVIIQYANGNVRKKKSFLFARLSFSPPIRDGSTIIVYTKEPKPPFNATQFLAATASATTSIMTLYLVYQNNK
ncbi:MAG: SLBB domain-containing protein [Candidatus Neomarinimicrobiota bacterium]